MSINGRIRAMLIAGAALALVGAGITPVVAQQAGTVQGTVVDATTGRGLAGVQISVAGTNVRGGTNTEGEYRLSGVPAGTRTVTATRVGYTTGTQTVTLAAGGAATANFRLATSAVELEGLVVTALGITRQERSIGTAVQQVTAEELTTAREVNIVNALSGKVSGVTVTNAGPQGGSSRIVIRGASSIAGNNQPLFIVDGIPIDNSAPRLGGFGGVDYGNAAQDINPNDIASISVLKGPNAAALYGSRAANGAIVITTKSGKGSGDLGITASQNVTFENPLRLPNYQNEFGQGSGGKFDYVDGNYGGVNDGTDESWGPRLDGRLIRQFFSNGEPAPWVASPNNVRDFFETGRTLNTNVSLATSSDKANVRLSLSRMDQDGMYPGFGLERTTIALNGGSNLTNRLSASAAVQYIASDGNNRPGVGYDGDNPMLQFVWFGRQVDVAQLREMYFANPNQMSNWNYSYHSNPYWIALANSNFDSRDRIIGNVSGTFKVTDWLSATGRSGTDWYEDSRKRTYAAGTIGLDYVGDNGAFVDNQQFFQETNTEFLLSANPELSSDWSVNANVGGNRRDYTRRFNNAFVRNLSAPGVFSLSNAADPPVVTDYRENKQVNSLFGQAQLGFRDFLFLEATGRNDWSSTLPDDNNSYFYPSVSASFIFTDALSSMVPSAMSFGKLRASWARVGNDADPYQLTSVYTPDQPFNGVPRFAVNNVIPNAGLKPENTESWEIGTEMRFLNDRLTLDGTYYNSATTNQILAVDISPTTGFTRKVLNAGEVSNKGVELLASAIPIRLNNGFEWEITGNFAKNNSEVTELFGDVQSIVLGNYWSLTVEARKGEPYGALYGFGYQRDPNGNIIVSGTTGRPLRSTDKRVLGNYNPDWVGGLNNRFSFGGLDFSFLIDTKQGGELFSVTNMFGRYAGILAETVEGRGYDGADSLLVQGVVRKVSGSDTTYVPNTTKTTAERYNHGLYGLHEAHVFDASFVKLREVKLGYNLPTSLTQRVKVSGINLSLVGRNLWLKTNAPHIDPETAFDASNAQGLEFGQFPSARSVGFNVVIRP
jgi:TonB-linked SusC/RagA family outer membrane protein